MKEENNELWAEGSFIETLAQDEAKEKMKTFHKQYDKDMNFNCRECNKKISAHNKDWHNCMCDNCSNRLMQE